MVATLSADAQVALPENTRVFRHRRYRLAGLALLCALLAPTPGWSALIVVDDVADPGVPGDGACTLREAIANANADADVTQGDCAAGDGADTVTLRRLSGVILLDSMLPPVSGTLLLLGPRAQDVQIDGGDRVALLTVLPGADLHVQSLVLQNGRTVPGPQDEPNVEGPIANDGRLTLVDTRVVANRNLTGPSGCGQCPARC